LYFVLPGDGEIVNRMQENTKPTQYD